MTQTNNPESVAVVSILQGTLDIVSNTLLNTSLENESADDILQDSLILVGRELQKGNIIAAFEALTAMDLAIGKPYVDSQAERMARLNKKESGFNDRVEYRQEAYAELYSERQELYSDYLTPLSQSLMSLAIDEHERSK